MPLPLETLSTQTVSTNLRRPLLVGTSGGAGCNTSIEAIANTLVDEGVIDLPMHTAKLLQDKKMTFHQFELWTLACLMNEIPLISPGICTAINLAHYPVFPDRDTLRQEMIAINDGQKNVNGSPKKRRYIDMLLDVSEAGYLYIAIHNTLTKRFSIKEARNMVDQQLNYEERQYKTVKKFFFNKLKEAEDAGTPYSEIITTQMLSLDAICAAVIQYNETYGKEICVHQYMSDVFTEGAQHYVAPLSRLNEKERTVLHLHGMNITTSQHLLANIDKMPFASIEEILHKENPMVRKGFKDPVRLAKFARGPSVGAISLPVQCNGNNDRVINIEPIEKIASVMLSSVGGDDSVDYAERLAKIYQNGRREYDKIFVFCGKNTSLKKRLEQVKNELQGRANCLSLSEPGEIIILDAQDDTHVANLLMSSDLAVLRGGVVLMEEMSLNHRSDQRFFFHHAEDEQGKLTTGLPWEDASIGYFIDHVREKYKIEWAKKGTVDILHAELTQQQNASSTFHMLEELQSYIQKFSNTEDVTTTLQTDLNTAIYQLLQELRNDILDQQGKNHTDKKIRQSVSYRLAGETLQFVNKLAYTAMDRSPAANQELKQLKIQELIKTYDERAYAIAHNSRFVKSILCVIVVAVGFSLGVVIGGTIGILAGIWTGPGAVASALIGLSTGGFTGAALGLTLAATATGIAATTLTVKKHSFFKPTPIESAAQTVSNAATSQFTP